MGSMRGGVVGGMLCVAALGVSLITRAAEPQIRLTAEEIAQLAQAAAAKPHRGPDMLALNGDASQPGLYSQRVSIPAHTRVPPHTHRDDRAVYIVSGTLYVGYGGQRDEALLKALPPGSYYTEPAATAHFTETHDDPVVILVTGFGPSDTHLIGGPPAAAPGR
jgi:quercetin dioxygenase-like cupin family protein